MTLTETLRPEAVAELVECRRLRDHYLNAAKKTEDEVQQILGKAIGFPWYKDDQEVFPGATEESGVCVFDHTAATLALTVVCRLVELEQRVKELEEELARLHNSVDSVADLAADSTEMLVRDVGIVSRLNDICENVRIALARKESP